MKNYYYQAPIIILGLLLIAGCNKPTPVQPSGKTIKIGIIAPLTGANLYKGKEGLKGINYILKTTPLLDNGDKVELFVKDDSNDPIKSLNALKELHKNNVSAILTLSSSNAVLGLTKYADKLKIPIISLLATNSRITLKSKHISQLGFNDHFQGIAAALFVHDELLIKRVAIFKNPRSIYSKDLASTFKKKFLSMRGNVIMDNDVVEDPILFKRALQNLKEQDVQLLYVPIAANHVIKLLNIINELDWEPKVMGADGLLASMLTQYNTETHKLDGIISTDFYSSNIPLTDFGVETKSGYEREHGNLTSYSMMGIEGITLLKIIINQCPAIKLKSCINEKLLSGISFTGLIGKIFLNSDSATRRVLLVNEIKDGKLNYLVQIY